MGGKRLLTALELLAILGNAISGRDIRNYMCPMRVWIYGNRSLRITDAVGIRELSGLGIWA